MKEWPCGSARSKLSPKKRLEHRLARDRHRHRHIARGQALRQAHEVRHDAGLLHGEHRAGSPEAGRHLIEDDEDTGLARDRDEACRKLGRQMRMPPAPCSSGSMISAATSARAIRQTMPRSADSAPASRSSAASSPSKVEGKGSTATWHIRSRNRLKKPRAAPDRHGAERVAVIAAVEGDQHAPPRLAAIGPILIGDLERDLDRGRAVVGEEHPGEIAGKERASALARSTAG